MPKDCSMTDSSVFYTCVFKHIQVCFCDTTVRYCCFRETNIQNSHSHPIRRVKQSWQTLYKWMFWLCVALSEKKKKKGAGLWYTICPKCLCKGYALGLSHSILHDCSLHLRFHFALWYRKPCIEACSSAASLQWPHWGRDPERMHGAQTKPDINKICWKPINIPFWFGLVNMQSTLRCCLRA